LSKEQLEMHLGLYEGYVKHVNLLHDQLNTLAAQNSGGDFDYAISELRRRLGFEWNGMRLHELYFEALEGGGQTLLADTALYKALSKQYGNYSSWLEIFEKTNARGPGWALLHYDPVQKIFFNTWVADHDVGHLAGTPIILAVDHWEHAFLVDYKPNEKGAYVQAYINALNWETVAKRFDSINA
jgi:Fe-Mn family superoxide dismutase